MKNKQKVIVQPEVFIEAEKIFDYIKSNSPQNAERFRKELLKQINEVETIPTAFPSEKLLNRKQILYRFAIVMRSWKLIFKVTSNFLVFIGIVHTKQHAKEVRKLKSTR
jgi:hypothetical protein